MRRIAVVIGAGGAVGRASAAELAKIGWDLALGDLDYPAAQATLAECSGSPASGSPANGSICATIDLTSVASIREFFRRVGETFGGMDALVNAAGIRTPMSILKLTEELWDQAFAINAKGPFFCIQEAVPLLLRHGGGTIINIGSISATRGFANRASYGSAKAALHGLTRHAAAELAAVNITVNTVSPGFISGTAMTGMYTDDTVAAMLRTLPPGSRRSDPGEIARLVASLVDTELPSLTGESIAIDGGLDDLITIDAEPWAADPDLLALRRASPGQEAPARTDGAEK